MLALLQAVIRLMDRLGLLERIADLLQDEVKKKNTEIDSAVSQTKADPGNLSRLKHLTNELPDADADSERKA